MGKNEALRQFLYNTAIAQCNEWIKLDKAGGEMADYIKGFWIGLGFSILAVELAGEYPEADTEALAEFMHVEVGDRGSEVVEEITNGGWMLYNSGGGLN